MPRPLLDESHIHPAIRDKLAQSRQSLVREVVVALPQHDVVVVGMAMNPFPRKARKLLDAAGQPYQYLEYGSYLSQWRDRNALKMWTGWPTFPMIFVRGTLIGGAGELQALLQNGGLKKLLAPAGAAA